MGRLNFTPMTRRTAILLGLGFPLFARPTSEYWETKDPKDWTEDERKQLLTDSPWAREATVKYNLGAAGLGMVGAGGTARRSAGRMPSAPAANTRDGAPLPTHFDALVRWESALPVREANKNKLKDDPAANYIVGVSGDLPMLGRASNDETDEEYSQRLDMLKQYTKLEKKGDPIYLMRVGASKDGALFYFERNDLITLHDGSVTFVTKLGPLDVKCKFGLKEMVYRGKLEL